MLKLIHIQGKMQCSSIVAPNMRYKQQMILHFSPIFWYPFAFVSTNWVSSRARFSCVSLNLQCYVYADAVSFTLPILVNQNHTSYHCLPIQNSTLVSLIKPLKRAVKIWWKNNLLITWSHRPNQNPAAWWHLVTVLGRLPFSFPGKNRVAMDTG